MFLGIVFAGLVAGLLIAVVVSVRRPPAVRGSAQEETA